MTVIEAIETRRSVRKYKDTPIEDEKLIAVLEAGRISHSARNAQDWKFIIVREPTLKAVLAEASENQPSMISAPAALVAIATDDRVMLCGVHTEIMDTTIAFTAMQLRAWELGLGTCWLGRFHADRVHAALNLADTEKVIAMSPLGYPDEVPDMRPRKSAEEVYAII